MHTTGTDLSSFLEAIKGGMSDLSVSNLQIILLAGIGIAVGPALAWFGFRYVKGKATKALFKGKL